MSDLEVNTQDYDLPRKRDNPEYDSVTRFPFALHPIAVGEITEADCTHHEIKAITGYKTDAEVRRYTAKADQVRLAHSAFEKLQDTANDPKPANSL